MKKILLSLLLLAAPALTFAQLTVFTNTSGNVSIKTSVENPYAYLMVSPSTYTSYYGYNMAIQATPSITSDYNIGVCGAALASSATGSGRAFGLYGIAGNCTNGYNYGVLGILSGLENGGGVVGSLTAQMGIQIPGRYAGYFDGTTKVDGTLYATSVVNTSDIRLKENIISLADIEDGCTTLENIQKMNVIEYNFKEKNDIPDEEKDTIKTKVKREDEDMYTDRHYGLSAQELQSIYPNLVKEGQDGYLGVNYIELVPILIRSIQELKQELDELKGTGTCSRDAAYTSNNSVNSNSELAGQSFTLQGVRVNNHNGQRKSAGGNRRLVLK